MASVPDILGLTHIAVTSAVQLIVALRRQFRAFNSLPGLLASSEEKTRRIESSIGSLLELAEVTELESDFFRRACSEVQETEKELASIHNEWIQSSSRAAFVASSNLMQRLSEINGKLDNLDRVFSTVGLTGDIITKQLRLECAGITRKVDNVVDECTDLRTRLNELSTVLNQVLEQQNPSAGVQSVLTAIQDDSSLIFDGLSRNRRIACDLYAMEHYAQVYYSLGRSYYTGEHESGQNYYMAARYLRAAFEGGAKSASYYLGKLYYDGRGVNRCFNTAFKYYSVGGELGHTDSLYEVGWCHEFGHGAIANIEVAMKYYSRAASQGSAKSTNSLGYRYLHGNGTQRNWPRARRLLEKARQMGAIRANFDLANLYMNGIGGVERNPKHAVELLTDAYHAGDELATSFLAECYYSGFGVRKDFEKAAAMFRELKGMSLLGKKYQGYLGLMMILGLGVQKNVRGGLKLIQKGLDKTFGCGWACYGDCFRFGLGVEKDLQEAAYYYSKATSCWGGSRGIREGHLALAEMYEVGEGVISCDERATHHYIEAANRMNHTAQWKAATFLEAGTGIAPHQYRAFYFFDLAARGGHVLSQRRAGELYMKGIGVQRDRTRAAELLEKAAEHGDPVAKKILRRQKITRYFKFGRPHSD